MKIKKRTRRRAKHERRIKNCSKLNNSINLLNSVAGNNKNVIQFLNSFYFLFLCFNIFVTISDAVCPATFLAQAISQTKAPTFEFYLTKSV